MSDDVCGADTTSDQPCQNPAGENGRCWIPSHNDPGAENPQGRDFTITKEDHQDILEAARLGKSERGCARAAGVSSWAQLERYLDAHPDFRSSFERARSEGETAYIEGGRDAESDVDPSFAKFMLASSYDYKKTEKREVTGGGGGPVEVDITETVVETPHSDED